MLANILAVQGQSFNWDPMGMWHTMGIPGKGVVIALLVMSAWSVRFVVDRAWKLTAARK
jgi:hypothetical protein